MGCRVLILEDDPNLRGIYTVQLNSLGHTTTPVGSGEEALKCFKSGDFDCLLVNARLPKMSGLDFVKKVREQDLKVGIVVSTAGNHAEVDRQCEGLGVWSVVEKTSPILLIEEKIHEACELAHLSPEKEAAFIEGLNDESKQLAVIRKDLMNETGAWTAIADKRLHKV
jgi:CheY-like chemotaxis protein